MIPVEFILGIFLHRQLRSRFLRGSQLRKHGWEASIDRLQKSPRRRPHFQVATSLCPQLYNCGRVAAMPRLGGLHHRYDLAA